MKNIKVIWVLFLLMGLAGASQAKPKGAHKAEAVQPTPVAQNAEPSPSKLSLENSQQQIDKAAGTNLFTLETVNAQEVFQALISARGVDLNQIPEEYLSKCKKELAENEKLLAVLPVNLYGLLIFSDKNIYAWAKASGGISYFSPESGILRIPYGAFTSLSDNYLETLNKGGKALWNTTVNMSGKPIIVAASAEHMDLLLRKLLETSEIIEACKNLDSRNGAIKSLPDITDLSGICGVSGGATYESVRAAVKPDLAVAFSEVCLEKKLVDPLLEIRRIPGIEEAGIPFNGELKQFLYNDMTIGSYSFNFVDGKLYFILRHIPDTLYFGAAAMGAHSIQDSGQPITSIENKFSDKHPLILKSMKKYGNPVFLMNPNGGRPGRVRWQWENENGVLFVDFLSGFDERIKVEDEGSKNKYRYSIATANEGYQFGNLENKIEFKIDGAGYGYVSSEKKTATFPLYSIKKEFDYALSTMPPPPAEGQKSYFIAIRNQYIKPSAEMVKNECEDSVKLIDKAGVVYKSAHVTTRTGDKNTSIFCFNIPKELTTFAAQIGAYNIGLEPDAQGYYFIAPVDWDSLEKHKPKIDTVMYYSKAVRDYVLGKKESAAKEAGQLKQQEIKAAEKALNF